MGESLVAYLQDFAGKALALILEEPAHLIVEAVLVVFVVYLLFKRSYRIEKEAPAPLTAEEQETLIREWEPLPIIDEAQRRETIEANLGNEDGSQMLVVHSSAGPYVSLSPDTQPDHLNLVSTGYLNYQDNEAIIAAAETTLRSHGVSTCGPRGFYGTVDVHLELESAMAKFFGTEEAVLYSSGFATISSVIPAFSKGSDWLFVDKGVSFAVQTGVALARSKTTWFNHNDFKDLRKQFEKVSHIFDGSHRIFVVVEGLYYNCADILPLPELLDLKKEFPFRIICDESHSVGVLGKTGRGITEHYGLPTSSIEIIAGSTGNAMGGIGGFSVGDPQVTSHQRLSSSGYVFSCSLPPFVATATTKAFEALGKGINKAELAQNIKDFATVLKLIKSFDVVHNDTPVAHLRLKKSLGKRLEDEKLLQHIVDTLRIEEKVIVSRSHYCKQEKFPPPPSIRLVVCAKHTLQDLDKAVRAIEKVASKILSQAN